MIDLESVLNLEEQFYREGFEEGRQENLRHNLLEGKQYGLQVGFQRYVTVGLMKGACEVILENSSLPQLHKTARSIIDMIEEIPMDNEESNVVKYDKNLTKVKNKFRLLLMAYNRPPRDKGRKLSFEDIDNISKTVAGDVQGYIEIETNTTNPQVDFW
ncbi:LAMI_0F02476g1_1 [Lachancea mirantina]|uniref:LAMI_0F02476g1_1 n=1 Tax=Lachancea mirantina TaxID=1230905 RepID=A0A1G4JWQ9_9SACH|nr:LAMI_0F02476g1_1 [Lachancea mirantina]